jgi:mono/diheme cytochrome c family protein
MFFRATPVLRAALAFAGASALAVTACSQNDSDVPPIPEGAVQYHAHVRPIFEARCVGCHSSGGIAPFSMAYDATEWASGAPPWVKSALDAVEQGTMPPWLPAADCRELAYERKLGDDEKTLLTEWAKQGFVEGDARNVGHAAVGRLIEHFEPHSAGKPTAVELRTGAAADDPHCLPPGELRTVSRKSATEQGYCREMGD